jgi:site-specific recombinase XerD
MHTTDAIEGFLIDLRARKRSPNTLRHYEHKLRIWSRWMEAQGVSEIKEVTIAHLRAFMLELERTPVTRHHPGRREHVGDPLVSDITVHGYAQALKTFCAWLVDEELLEKVPALRLAKPAVTHKLIRSFTTQHLQSMFAACDLRTHLGFRDYTFMLVLIDTGIRSSELCGLRLDGVQGDHLIVMGKGRKQREIGIMPTTAKYLWKYIKVHRHPSQPDEHVFLCQWPAYMTR